MATCSRCHRRFPHDDCHVCGHPPFNEPVHDEGLAAAMAGCDRTENPYWLRMAPECHDGWDKGWMNGDEERNPTK